MQNTTKRSAPQPNRRTSSSPTGYRKPPVEVVDPRWLLRAGGVMIAVCLLCAWVAICILFYKTQWQLVLHPSRTMTHSPAEHGLKAEDVHFGIGPNGQPQLHGWWIPGDQTSDPVVLMLPGADGSASDLLARAKTFHDSRLNVLLFDYRGYGASTERHPTEATMQADSETALDYLENKPGFVAGDVLLYGTGIGSSLAVNLVAEHSQITALILEQPDGDLAPRAADDPRSKLVPFRWLFHESFPLAASLDSLSTPKLLLRYASPPEASTVDLRKAANPKMLVDLPARPDEIELRDALRRFLDSYVTHPAGTILQVGD